MSVDLWVIITNCFVAVGTLFLGAMALKAIRQTNKFQRNEKTQRKLNEISQWAIDITERASEWYVEFHPELVTMEGEAREVMRENWMRFTMRNLWLKYNALTGRRERIIVFAEDFKEYKLDRIVNLVSGNLDKTMNALEGRCMGEVNDELLRERGTLLHKIASALVRVTSRIKTEGIG